ncbi:MAG: Omp28-related outer membrane protein [Bacteroidaceae bacterium]|nr:Omp28-related outer membrane protein [Bacteroidaceae bacterium]
MIRRLFTLLLSCAALSVMAQDVVHYGYAPDVMAETDMVAQGQGANGYLAGLVCLDPSTDPVMERLAGHQILGVRCYLRADYKQARNDRSFIMHTTSPDAEPTKKICDFLAGWNEVYFDEPLTIGSEPVYVGMQVYEQRGTSHPFVSYGAASVPGACWINLDKEGWINYNNRGTLLIQVILDDEAAPIIDNMVYAQVASAPQTVAPSVTFDCEVYFNNYTNRSVNGVQLQMLGQGDETPYTTEVFFDTPLAPREGRNVPMQIYAGSETGVSQWVSLSVSTIDGEVAQEACPGLSYHYVTKDAFQRVSLVEEFTSQSCTNCPFMIYYLDKAMHQYDKELVYITHHTGFANDFFTHSGEDELIYLFGQQYSYNPAVMYDRRVFTGEIAPVNGASVAETTPYTDAFNIVTEMLAMASVDIEFTHDENAGTIACSVSGRVNSELVAAGVDAYLTVALVEDSIAVSDKYFQVGLDDTGEGVPEDLQSSFRHNGVKRHVFTAHAGDLLTLGSENEYSVSFDAVEINPECNLDNCRIVAFVHKVDKEDMNQNEVLNAAQRWITGTHSVEGIESDDNDVRFVVNADRTISPFDNVASYRIYNVQGKYMPVRSQLLPGVYVVRYVTLAGNTATTKVVVR